MLDSIHHLTLKILEHRIFHVKTALFNPLLRDVITNVVTFPKICQPLVVHRFYCMALYRSQTRRHMINKSHHKIEDYTSAHISLNVLKKLWKGDKM